MRNTKKAFTLVELIVVITILAVLGTIAFVSLQGYSGEARDSKRLSNVNDLVKKINIEMSKGTPLSSTISSGTSVSGTVVINGDVTGQPQTVEQGTVNFLTIKENQADFNDNGTDYPYSYAEGGAGTGSYKFVQVATKSEANNTAVVVGNYYKMDTNDSDSIIFQDAASPSATTYVTHDGVNLPY